MAEKPLQDLVARLEAERLAADRRYNDALTALDAASRALSGAPAAPAVPLVTYDPSQLPLVNESWQILKVLPRRRPTQIFSGFAWRLLGPVLERQQQFNAALVDHLNRNVGAHAEAASAIAGVRASLTAEHAAREQFHAALIAYLQTITEYVDTKDRAMGGPELREQIVLANERALALKRELAARPQATGDRPQATGDRPQASEAGTPATGNRQPTTDFSYVGFEDRFRGSQDEIRSRLRDYVPVFVNAVAGRLEGGMVAPVLDVGCGRGELLALLSEAGVPARGIDVNGEMVALCRERGFDAAQSDALTYLDSLPDASLGGLAAIQVVEHLEPSYLSRFLEAAFHKLRPGAPIVLETINPACWMAFFEAYIRDLTHAQPLHPDTLRFLVQASGFSSVDVQYRSPVSDADRLETVKRPGSGEPPALAEAIAAINAHADKLNTRLFSYMDYAVVARR